MTFFAKYSILHRFQYWIKGSWETWRDPLLEVTKLQSGTMGSWDHPGPMSMTWSWWDLWGLSTWTSAPMFTLMDWWGRWDPSEMTESWGHQGLCPQWKTLIRMISNQHTWWMRRRWTFSGSPSDLLFHCQPSWGPWDPPWSRATSMTGSP